MTDIRLTIEIGATPAHVWSIMREVERWPEWTASVSGIRRITPGPFAIGSRVEIRQPGLPSSRWEVTALEADLGFTWVSRSPGVRVTGEHWVAEPRRRGCRAALSHARTPGFVGPLHRAAPAWHQPSATWRWRPRASSGAPRPGPRAGAAAVADTAAAGTAGAGAAAARRVQITGSTHRSRRPESRMSRPPVACSSASPPP
jgi:hypothetical protein